MAQFVCDLDFSTIRPFKHDPTTKAFTQNGTILICVMERFLYIIFRFGTVDDFVLDLEITCMFDLGDRSN